MASPGIYVSEEELAIIKAILSDVLGGEKVYVFGSRARGNHRTTSDLDLAIRGNAPLSMSTRSALEFAFSESILPYRVDVVDEATIDEPFRKAIMSEAIELVYG